MLVSVSNNRFYFFLQWQSCSAESNSSWLIWDNARCLERCITLQRQKGMILVHTISFYGKPMHKFSGLWNTLWIMVSGRIATELKTNKTQMNRLRVEKRSAGFLAFFLKPFLFLLSQQRLRFHTSQNFVPSHVSFALHFFLALLIQ